MELVVRQPQKWVPKILTAGALFVGPYTPEAVGDFVAGPSHVLPTGGTCIIFRADRGGFSAREAVWFSIRKRIYGIHYQSCKPLGGRDVGWTCAFSNNSILIIEVYR